MKLTLSTHIIKIVLGGRNVRNAWNLKSKFCLKTFQSGPDKICNYLLFKVDFVDAEDYY